MGSFDPRCLTSPKACPRLGRGSHGQTEEAWAQAVAHGLDHDQHCGRDPGQLQASGISSCARQVLCVDVANGSAVETRNVACLAFTDLSSEATHFK